jgi:uncharacterized protein (TIGR02145 family)
MKNLFLFLVLMIFCSFSYGQNNNETVTDIDGNVYKTVTIGTQTWMAGNLKVTKYTNGEPIPNIIDGDKWRQQINAGAYCWYNNDISNKDTYGALYNWYAVDQKSPDKRLAPAGWRVATIEDWQILIDYIGGKEVAGGKLKETGTKHWLLLNEGATDEYGFTALPGGIRFIGIGTKFTDLGAVSWWWTSSSRSLFKSNYVSVSNGVASINISEINPCNGFAVRCIKD